MSTKELSVLFCFFSLANEPPLLLAPGREEEEGLGWRHVCYRRGQRSGLQPKCYVWHAAEAPAAVAPALSVSSLRNAALALKGTCNGKI